MTRRLTRRRLLVAGAGLVAGGGAAAAVAERELGDEAGGTPSWYRPGCPTPGQRDGDAPARLDADDRGVVLRHGDGPDGCDRYGARDAVVWRVGKDWYMNYDGAGEDGWRVCLATSADGVNWAKRGAVLPLGGPGAPDSASASYGIPVADGDGRTWHLFYLGTTQATPPPDRTPTPPYVTLKAKGPSPEGPWTKEPQVVPFAPAPGTYYSESASPGTVIQRGVEFWQYTSVSSGGNPLLRTLAIARTQNLDGGWVMPAAPILPGTEQIENSALYLEEATGTWFLFTNHIGAGNYASAVWVYWSQDPAVWDPRNKATVIDGSTCCWSRAAIGLPSVVVLEDRIAVYYDGVQGTGTAHTGRDVGVAYLPRPLKPPAVA